VPSLHSGHELPSHKTRTGRAAHCTGPALKLDRDLARRAPQPDGGASCCNSRETCSI